MSIPDHLIEPYLKQLTEWTDEEIATATLHGLEAAAAARAEFTARFSKRTFG